MKQYYQANTPNEICTKNQQGNYITLKEQYQVSTTHKDITGRIKNNITPLPDIYNIIINDILETLPEYHSILNTSHAIIIRYHHNFVIYIKQDTIIIMNHDTTTLPFTNYTKEKLTATLT